MFIGMMADAATASHEDHTDIGDIDHGHPVMPGAARQFEDAIALGRNGVADLTLQPVRAGHGTIFVCDVQLERQAALLEQAAEVLGRDK